MQFDGIQRIYGKSAERIREAHILVVGIGGVGSWVAEALARTGVGKLTLADPDDLCASNINRQVHALHSTVGKYKVETMRERIRDINPACEVLPCARFINEASIESVLDTTYDHVVDAIDGVMPKASLIARCRQRDLPVVTCGGSGGKTDPSLIQLVDLAYTQNDRLLSFIRKKLRHVFNFPAHGPFGVPCVYSPEPVRWPESSCSDSENPLLTEAGSRLNCDGRLGAVSFVTGTFGFRLAAWVIQELVLNNDSNR